MLIALTMTSRVISIADTEVLLVKVAGRYQDRHVGAGMGVAPPDLP
jgi:hypothetical protein